jgi:CheY-like chemotaxis protein
MARILIVDDEYAVVNFLSRAIMGAGHTLDSAKNGQHGLERAKAERPDLIIMDLSMPKLNGWDATRKLKADPDTAGIPIIALTSAVTSTDRDEAYSAGCDAFETKPVDLSRLLGRITELTSR